MSRTEMRSLSSLEALRTSLTELGPGLDSRGQESQDWWPGEQLDHCIHHGVMEWFVERRFGGQAWSTREITEGYLGIGSACLTTAFVLTQLTAAIRRIAASPNAELASDWLPALAKGERLATVGISHLTTSRRHLRHPTLRAERTAHGFRLDGSTPWVTGASRVDALVTGGELPDGQQVLLLVPTNAAGVTCEPPMELVALSASSTSTVHLERVDVPSDHMLAGPRPDVLQFGGGQTGGLPTSTLALALTTAAIDYLDQEGLRRTEIQTAAELLRDDWIGLTQELRNMADGEPGSLEFLRQRSNSLVLRATQAALVAAKGTGYVAGHPAGRWCREALFFLVWSCPQSVAEAN
ncbi:MAG TPA: acyl-CoA dehydrogenase family protein, partial [Pirellulaceae bacterium]